MARFATTLAWQIGTARLAGPLWVLLFLNLAAIPLGFALHAWSAALAALASWALVNAGVAAAALFATRKSVSRRPGDLGFAIPLPARIKFPVDEPVYGIVDCVSSTGFRFHGRFPEYVQFGAKVSGELHLPGGALPFGATIRSFYLGRPEKGERFAKSVGLSFDWVGAPRDRAANRMLGERDLQGRIAELLECDATPVGWLERLCRRGDARLPSRPEHWAPVLIHAPQEARGRPEVGMIAVSTPRGSPRTVLTFAPLATESKIHLSVLSRPVRQPLDGTVAAARIVDTPLAPIYTYQFTAGARASA
jgi:hypothetical protein